MRVMIDTNVLISIALFPSPSMRRLLCEIDSGGQHTVVLSTYVLSELKHVVERKFPAQRASVEKFLRELKYELVYAPEEIDATQCPPIRDAKDLPILVSAIEEDVDILLTGDADFADLPLDRPAILTPGSYLAQYGTEGDLA